MKHLEWDIPRSKNSIYNTNETLENIENHFAKIEKFNDTMNMLYQGNVEISNNVIYIELGKSKETTEEIFAVLKNAEKYPNDYNLRARIYTQETNKKIGETLNNFWLELYQKYMIGWSKDEDDSNEDNFWNDESIYIYTEFTFSDIKKFGWFLRSLERIDDILIRNIALVINSLGQKIYKGFNDTWTDEELDIYNGVWEIYKQIERLGIKEEIEIGRRSDYLLALKDGYIDKYKECINAWFYTKISSEDIIQPIFFDDTMNNKIDTWGNNTPEEYKNAIIQIDQDIKDSWYIFDRIKETQPLVQKVTEELEKWITNTINSIKENASLDKTEKMKRLDQFNEYLYKIRYMHR